jgi:PAS domain S-box-containing protein
MGDLKKRVLLVEDEALIAVGEMSNLQDYGYDAVHVLHGEKAIETINAADPPFDLVLMDVDLGKGIDGPETARRILKLHDLPIIFLSSHTSREVVETTELISSYGYVVKSSSITVLNASIKMAFSLHEARLKIERDALKIASHQQALEVSEIRYRSLFESAKDDIIILNAETGLIDDVNPYLLEMLGYSREQFIRKSIWDINAFPDKEYSKALFRELQTNDYISYEDVPLETASGEKISVEFVSNVYLVYGQRVIQCNIRNIMKRKQRELITTKSLEADAALLTQTERYTAELLQIILKLVELRLASTSNRETENALHALARRIEIIANLQSLRSQEASEAHVDLQAYCERQIEQIAGLPANLHLRFAMEARSVTMYEASVVSLILGEILLYVLGKSPADSQPDSVVFSMNSMGPKAVLTVAHQGVMSAETLESICTKNVGMHFAELLADLLNGGIKIVYDKATTIRIDCDLT